MTPLERKLDAELRHDLQSKRKLTEEQGLEENWIIREGKSDKIININNTVSGLKCMYANIDTISNKRAAD